VSRRALLGACLALALAGCGGAVAVDRVDVDAPIVADAGDDAGDDDAGDAAPDCTTATGYYVDDAGVLWGYRCLPSKPL
jgi:hypothetical protein